MRLILPKKFHRAKPPQEVDAYGTFLQNNMKQLNIKKIIIISQKIWSRYERANKRINNFIKKENEV